MDRRRRPGGIVRVLEIIEDHKAAFVYDFRNRFRLGLSDLGTKVPWSEVVYMVAVLLRDPSSWLQTSVAGWHHPITYEWPILASIYDLHAQVNSKRKPKPYPRPWPKGASASRRGRVRNDAREILAKAKNGGIKWQNRHTPT